MRSIKLYFAFILFLGLFTACKNDTSKGEELVEVKTKNDVSAFKGTGMVDISETNMLKQDQFLPEGSSAFLLKSENTLRLYLNASQPIAFGQNEVFAIVGDTTSIETNFKVRGVDLNGANTTVSIETVPTGLSVSSYRPSFIFSIPKKDVKGYPEVSLNGKQVALTIME